MLDLRPGRPVLIVLRLRWWRTACGGFQLPTNSPPTMTPSAMSVTQADPFKEIVKLAYPCAARRWERNDAHQRRRGLAVSSIAERDAHLAGSVRDRFQSAHRSSPTRPHAAILPWSNSSFSHSQTRNPRTSIPFHDCQVHGIGRLVIQSPHSMRGPRRRHRLRAQGTRGLVRAPRVDVRGCPSCRPAPATQSSERCVPCERIDAAE